jgi:hypothetical protein
VQVSLDGTLLGTVGQDGTFSHATVEPGSHAVQFSMKGYDPVTLSRDFVSGEMLTLSAPDVGLKRSSGRIEFLADAGTQATVAQSGRTVRQFKGPTSLSLPQGTYDLTVTGAAGVPSRHTLTVTGASETRIDLRSMAVAGMEQFDLAGWMRDDSWYTRKGGTFVLYNQNAPDGEFTFTIRLDRSGNPFSSGSRLKWVIGYVNNATHVMLQLDRDAFYRSDVVGGASQVVRVPHRIPTNVPFIHLSAMVSGSQLVHQFSVDGTNWQTIDSWNRTTPSGAPEPGRRTLLDGRFGFFLPGDEEIFVSNFLFYPESR